MLLSSQSTSILSSEYPEDNDIQALLEESQHQYKWGGSLGTADTLTYSFASSETFSSTYFASILIVSPVLSVAE